MVATDSNGNRGTMDVKVTVANEEEAGVVTLSRTQPRVGVAVRASLTDPDGSISGLTWQWSNADNAIEGANSDTYTPTAADATSAVTLTATASYTDGQGDMKSAISADAVNAVALDTRNQPPAFVDQDTETDGDQTESAEREVEENTEAVAGDDAAATADSVPTDNVGSPVTADDPDPNADPLIYTLSGADAGLFRVRQDDPNTMEVNEGGQIEVAAGTELDYETRQAYMVTVMAEDSFGDHDTIMVAIMVTDVDETPEIMRAPDANVAPEFASATTSRTVVENTAAGQDIGNPVAANDANGDALTYTLGGTDAAFFDIDPETGQLMTLAALDYETKATYEVMVTATDPDSASDMITVTITVTNEDEMGMVTLWAGTDAPLTMAPQVGDTITGAVMDPDGGVTGATWQWAKTMTPDMMDSWMPITDATNAAYMVTEGDTGYHLRVMATYTDAAGTDMAMEDSPATMMVTAMMTVPMFDSETATREVAENTEARMDIGDPVTGTDADGDTLIYALGGTDAASFYIDPETGQLKTLAALDYETKATYEVMVTATDPDSASDMITVTITVTNVDEMGMVTLWVGTDALTMAPQVGDTITGAVMDPDGGETVESWQWAKTMDTADMSSWMPITGATNAAYMVTEGDTGYHLRVMATYTDAAGTDMAMEDSPATMMVTAMMTVPMFDSETATREVAENTEARMDIGDPVTGTDADGDTLIYALGGTDAASFYIDPETGQLKTLAALDYETKATYMVMVTATDPDSASDMITVTITVTNEDEMGMVTLWAGADPLTMAPQVGDTITGAVMDPDGGVTGETWQWAKTKTPDMMESWMPITGATAAAYMVTEGDTGYHLRVMATYTDAAGTDMAMEDSPATMMVTAMMTVPMFDSETATREVAENTEARMGIGDPVTGTDADGDTLIYALGGTDAASFYIDPETGQLKTLAALDYETKATYMVMVTATDPDSASDMITVTITVTNVEEPGMVTLWVGTDALTMAPQVGDTITGAVMDPDGGETVESWQWAKTMDTADMSSWMPITGATNAAYMVTAGDTGYYLRVMATYTDAAGTDMAMEDSPATMMVTAVDEMLPADFDPLAKYDANDSGDIEKEEVIQAINDYLFGEEDDAISKDDVIETINLYLFGE